MSCPPELLTAWLVSNLPALQSTAHYYIRLYAFYKQPTGSSAHSTYSYASQIEADDVLQQAAINIWLHWHTCIDPQTKLECDDKYRLNWARRIVKNKVIDAARALKARPTDPLDTFTEYVEPSAYSDPAQQAIEHESTDAILDKLTRDQREVAELYLQGHTSESAARKLHLDQATVRQRKIRLKARLAAFYSELGPHPVAAH